MEQNSKIKFNDEEMAKHAKCFNQFYAKNNIASFWWDTKNKKKICIVLLMFIMIQDFGMKKKIQRFLKRFLKI